MEMGFAGRGMRMIDIEWWQNMGMGNGNGNGLCREGNENDRYRMVAEHGNGLCARRRESERQNMEWAEQGMVAEHRMTDVRKMDPGPFGY
jgi:hypothetical protein